MANVDNLLKRQALHMDQLMQDERVKRLVTHVADHAYLQGHVKGEHESGSCFVCEFLLVQLFPDKSGPA